MQQVKRLNGAKQFTQNKQTVGCNECCTVKGELNKHVTIASLIIVKECKYDKNNKPPSGKEDIKYAKQHTIIYVMHKTYAAAYDFNKYQLFSPS